jgi:hypothetical protein
VNRPALLTAVVAIIVLGCSLSEKPTPVPIPEGATELSHIVVSVGTPRGYQTEFTLRADFPASPVPELYAKALSDSWTRCDWSSEWTRFVDEAAKPPRTVHQQLHFWFNRDAGRTLELLARYYSSGDRAQRPENDKQRVVVTELINQNVDEKISKLRVKCPAKELRSNNTIERDARKSGARPSS